MLSDPHLEHFLTSFSLMANFHHGIVILRLSYKKVRSCIGGLIGTERNVNRVRSRKDQREIIQGDLSATLLLNSRANVRSAPPIPLSLVKYQQQSDNYKSRKQKGKNPFQCLINCQNPNNVYSQRTEPYQEKEKHNQMKKVFDFNHVQPSGSELHSYFANSP